jgi:hypothetical protein
LPCVTIYEIFEAIGLIVSKKTSPTALFLELRSKVVAKVQYRIELVVEGINIAIVSSTCGATPESP